MSSETPIRKNDSASGGDLANSPLLRAMVDNWWVALVRGLLAILFGVLTFVWPGISLLSLVLLFGAYTLVDGVIALYGAIKGRGSAERSSLWWLLFVGITGIAAGIITFVYPQVTALVLVIFIGAWALVRGIFEIIGAIRLRKEIDHEWLLILAGILSVIVGLFLLIKPGAGALALLWLIGGYAIAFGIILVWLAFRLKKVGTQSA
ncbi:HdeD family acid-resistance protein [Microbulbifer agarilyticus]|uniref:HdeD family acid-resistance protein n=1 Tax=Microbulbifer agarilyticus TaxID=260552 RepID=UPI001CD58A5B|nr:HdeD family acid-resistance protein [Microbulbifer agarilyticus]MCA0892519.1 HdeD family acid-resistance protein [Microbulbifer agarilyticus]MCA0899761.1 HdeD family acid-resistance protein [Microbulbifer agarilyticus]